MEKRVKKETRCEMKQEPKLEDRILKLALEESLEVIAVGYKMVKNKENEYGYLVERRTYDNFAERFLGMAKEEWKEDLRNHYNKMKEKR